MTERDWLDIARGEGPLRIVGFDVQSHHSVVWIRLVRNTGNVLVEMVTRERGFATQPYSDWNRPLWHPTPDEHIYVPAGQAVILQATKPLAGVLLVTAR